LHEYEQTAIGFVQFNIQILNCEPDHQNQACLLSGSLNSLIDPEGAKPVGIILRSVSLLQAVASAAISTHTAEAISPKCRIETS